ncbi:MAG: GNAT family N-acetyltransferase [Planctomycetaceae bacterium]|nr:GNAT family N-acetyltransferase [Planctomycetaceae bacterium]
MRLLKRVRTVERSLMVLKPGDLFGESALVLVKDVDDTLGANMAALERFSYRPLETEPNMVLTLAPRWKNYEDYLASLTGDYRRDARKLAKKVEAAGFELVRVDIAREAARLHELYAQVHAEQKMRLFKLAPEFLPVLAEELGERVRVLGLRKDGRLKAFTTLVVDGETAIGSFVGHERAALAEAPLYLRLLHELVAESIAVGARRLSLGRTALEPKARLGAKPERLRTWVRHRSPLLNLVLRSFLSAIPHDEAPERSPFKA